MIDSHCHLDHCSDPEAAVDPDLRAIVTVGTTVDRCRLAVAAAERHPNVWAAVGIHPNDASEALDPEARSQVETMAEHPRVVAIGESGFDRYWDAQTPEVQRASFDWQVTLARRHDKALILHVRDADGSDEASREAADAIRGAGWGRGVLHCFNGHPELLAAGLELGWMVSFAGNVTYKNAHAVRESATLVPADRLMVETDSPFLAPVPMRGKRNVPAYVRHTATALASLRGVPIAELEPLLDANAARLYGLPEASPPAT
ncbi:MAG: TatD family hydrolase [Trueperaceae bacterium]